jgi:hypothetical protein
VISEVDGQAELCGILDWRKWKGNGSWMIILWDGNFALFWSFKQVEVNGVFHFRCRFFVLAYFYSSYSSYAVRCSMESQLTGLSNCDNPVNCKRLVHANWHIQFHGMSSKSAVLSGCRLHALNIWRAVSVHHILFHPHMICRLCHERWQNTSPIDILIERVYSTNERKLEDFAARFECLHVLRPHCLQEDLSHSRLTFFDILTRKDSDRNSLSMEYWCGGST